MPRLPALFLALAIALPGAASAQDRDLQEIARYALTEDALAKYANATEKLRPIAGEVMPCNQGDADADSIHGVATRIDGIPRAKAAIEAAGLTPHEYAVFGLAVFHAGMAAWAQEQGDRTLPPGVTRANLDFYNAHKAAIEAIRPLEESACEQDGEVGNPVQDR